MAANPLVSIVISTYNHAEYLGAALDSALAQDYSPLEIVVYDAGSTDHTQKLLKEYHDPRLRPVGPPVNRGMVHNWNYAQSRAKGEYIKFLASDDLLAPTCVSELVAAARRHPRAAIVTCQRQFINAQGRGVKSLGFARDNKTVNGRDYAHWLLTDLRENKIGEPSAVLYPTRVMKKAGGYDPVFSQFADLEYWLRLLEHGELVYVNQPLCSFRLHEESNTSAAIRDGRFITETFALIRKYYNSPHYRQVFALSPADRRHVTRQKTLDILKNIKDLTLSGHLLRAAAYLSRLLTSTIWASSRACAY